MGFTSKRPSKKTHFQVTKKPVGLGRAVEFTNRRGNMFLALKLSDDKRTGTSRFLIFKRRK